jgi:hypothetical protein
VAGIPILHPASGSGCLGLFPFWGIFQTEAEMPLNQIIKLHFLESISFPGNGAFLK